MNEAPVRPPPLDRTPRWIGDPDGSQHYWDGQRWTDGPSATPQQSSSSGPGCLGWFLIIGALVLVIGAIGNALDGENEGSSTDESSEPSVTAGSFAATEANIEALVEDVDAGDNPKANCSGNYCEVSYDVEILGLNTDVELVLAQNEVWKEMFSDPKFSGGAIILRGPVESVGGKSSTAEILEVSCDRQADRQINWSAVDADGLRALCDWNELVSFD